MEHMLSKQWLRLSALAHLCGTVSDRCRSSQFKDIQSPRNGGGHLLITTLCGQWSTLAVVRECKLPVHLGWEHMNPQRKALESSRKPMPPVTLKILTACSGLQKNPNSHSVEAFGMEWGIGVVRTGK